MKPLDRSGALGQRARVNDPGSRHDVGERLLLFALIVVLALVLAPSVSRIVAPLFAPLVSAIGGTP